MEAIEKLPIPKVMSYAGPGRYFNDEKFVRPAHSLLALHGAEVVPIGALGLTAGRTTAGHRFLSRADIVVATADAYEETLRAEGKVVASFAERRAQIVNALGKAANGATVSVDRVPSARPSASRKPLPESPGTPGVAV